jgi:hypothetical protein
MPPVQENMPRYAHSAPAERTRRVQYDPWIEHLAWLMDSSIGIGRFSIGIDGLLGLVPGLGDAAASLISLFIVIRAVRAGVPRIAVARMLANIAADTLLGSVPVVGDVFDFAFKANIRNVRIYHQSMEHARGSTVRHWLFFAGLALVFLALLAIPVAVVILALRAR